MKKGFTLVELLAVITVLAIITVIAVPTVSRSIENSKQKSHDIQIKKMKEMEWIELFLRFCCEAILANRIRPHSGGVAYNWQLGACS